MFAPGQKVACVDDQFPLGIEKLYTALPKKDVIYTVRDLIPGVSLANTEGEVAVYLVELVNPANRHGIEYGFNAERFAPLDTVEDEIEEEIYAEEPLVTAKVNGCPFLRAGKIGQRNKKLAISAKAREIVRPVSLRRDNP